VDVALAAAAASANREFQQLDASKFLDVARTHWSEEQQIWLTEGTRRHQRDAI
jgi:hypothetical protein